MTSEKSIVTPTGDDSSVNHATKAWQKHNRPHLLLICFLTTLAIFCVSHLAYKQIQLFNGLNNERPRLNTYRNHIAPVSQWAQKSQTHAIGYLQTTTSPIVDAAKKSMTRYLLAPLILRQPENGAILVNFSSEQQQQAFEQSLNCHVVQQFGPGLALMEKNQ